MFDLMFGPDLLDTFCSTGDFLLWRLEVIWEFPKIGDPNIVP